MPALRIKSRLLRQLDKDIAAAPTSVRAACLRAKRAMLLARHGALTDAREALTELHQLAFQHPHPEISAWLHMAEGLMGYYTDFSESAQDKVLRACVIARTEGGMPEIEGLALAWLVHFAYYRHDYAALVEYGRDCLAVLRPEHHVAHARFAMALGLAWHHAGDAARAQPWYARARRHAASEGDDASLSALMYNMAEMRAAQACRETLDLAHRNAAELLLGADSVRHYDEAVGATVMNELTPLLRARILVLQGRYAEARLLYEQNLPQAMSRALTRLDSSRLSDLAWCQANCGSPEQALSQARKAEAELDPSCDPDDRAITHGRLAQVFALLGMAEEAQRHRAMAAQEWTGFAELQQDWRGRLEAAGFQP